MGISQITDLAFQINLFIQRTFTEDLVCTIQCSNCCRYNEDGGNRNRYNIPASKVLVKKTDNKNKNISCYTVTSILEINKAEKVE